MRFRSARPGTNVRCLLCSPVTLALAVAAMPLAHAEVFKWVDENGQTHYGERKPGSASASKVTIKPSTATAPATPPQPASTENWLRTPKPVAKAPTRPYEPPQRSRSGGREDGTDASRCALARDVLDGNLQHANGNPIDKHDLDVARNDIKLFCKSR